MSPRASSSAKASGCRRPWSRPCTRCVSTRPPGRSSEADQASWAALLHVRTGAQTNNRMGVAQLVSAPVSNTGSWGFESLHPCDNFIVEGPTGTGPATRPRGRRAHGTGLTVTRPWGTSPDPDLHPQEWGRTQQWTARPTSRRCSIGLSQCPPIRRTGSQRCDQCPPGGTGRHTRLRSACRKASRFDSGGGYACDDQRAVGKRHPTSFGTRASQVRVLPVRPVPGSSAGRAPVC